MIKGALQSKRDIRWHRRHIRKLQRRKEIRKLHSAGYRSVIEHERAKEKITRLAEGDERTLSLWGKFVEFIKSLFIRSHAAS